WRANMDALPSYLDSAGLVKFFPDMTEGSEVLTSYLLAIAQEAGWDIPAATRARMETALRQFVEGKLLRRSALPTADLALRKMAAIDALARWDAADASLLSSIAVDANLWPTSGVIDWLNVLRRLPEVPNREQKIQQAEQILRARLNFQGTAMNFSTEKTDGLWWLMVNGDVNAVRLILALLPSEPWQADMARLAQGALLRQRRGAWGSTVANAWGVLAFEKFSRTFESTPVAGESAARLSGRSQKVARREGRHFIVCLAGSTRGCRDAAYRRGETVGHGTESCRAAAQAAAVERLHNHQAAGAGGAQAGGQVEQRRHPPRDPRDRGAERHDLGGRR